MKKLKYVDETMCNLATRKPLVSSREHTDSVRRIRKKLKDHYAEKRRRYGIGQDSYYDRELIRLFSNAPEFAKRPTAAAFLRRHRRELRRIVADWTGQYQYTIDQVLSEMIERCRELQLRMCRTEEQTIRDAEIVLTVQTMNMLHHGHHKVAM